MKKKTLLETALELKPRRNHKGPSSEEEIELAIAWATDRITISQFARTLYGSAESGSNNNGSRPYIDIAMIFREAFRKGVIISK